MEIGTFLKRREALILATIISLYLLLEIIQISLPALYCEEALYAIGGLNVTFDKDLYPCIESIRIFGKTLPLMTNLYHGAMQSYFIRPFFYFFGVNVVSLRSASIFFGILALLFTYFFTKRFFNRKIAFITLALLVVNPSFIVGSRLGISLLVAESMAALFCFLRWYYDKRIFYFYSGMFLLGVGLSTNLGFTWFIGAVLVGALVYRKKIKEKITEKARFHLIGKYLLSGIIAFSLGAILILYYNLSNNFINLRYILKYFYQTGSGINNLHYIENLFSRIKIFFLVLNGTWFTKGENMKFSPNNLYPGLFLFCLIWLIYSGLFKKKIFIEKNKILFLLIIFFTIFVQSPFTPSSHSASHLFILFPFVQILIAVTLIELISLFKKRKFIIAAIFGVFLTIAAIDLKMVINYHLELKKTGGKGLFSDAIYKLAYWLEDRRYLRPIAVDWGIRHSIVILTNGRVVPRWHDYTENPTPINIEPEHTIRRNKFIRECREQFNNVDNIYIFHDPDFTYQDCLGLFKEIAKEMHKEIFEEQRFYQRDGKPVYILYSVY